MEQAQGMAAWLPSLDHDLGFHRGLLQIAHLKIGVFICANSAAHSDGATLQVFGPVGQAE